MLDHNRILVPTAARQYILQQLHLAHSGVVKTYRTARQLYYWPGMKNDIITLIEKCIPCEQYQLSKARPELIGQPQSQASTPMRHVAMDLFDAQGKSWLAMVCRYSGYAWLAKLGRTSTKDIILHRSPVLDAINDERNFKKMEEIHSDS